MRLKIHVPISQRTQCPCYSYRSYEFSELLHNFRMSLTPWLSVDTYLQVCTYLGSHRGSKVSLTWHTLRQQTPESHADWHQMSHAHHLDHGYQHLNVPYHLLNAAYVSVTWARMKENLGFVDLSEIRRQKTNDKTDPIKGSRRLYYVSVCCNTVELASSYEIIMLHALCSNSCIS